MIKCHVCSFECEDGAELCSQCGAELTVRETEITEETQENIINNPVLAVSVEDIVTAEIYRDILTENNIPFTCESDGGSMKIAFGGVFITEDIYVDESNLDRAKELYEEVLNVEPQFEEGFEEE